MNTDCKYCQLSFPDENTLRSHILVHEPKPEFTCQECGKNYSNKFNYGAHLKLVHSEKKPVVFSCPESECSFSCKDKKVIRSHYEEAHNYDVSTHETLNFQNLRDFNTWKDEYCLKNRVQFSRNSNRQFKLERWYFTCHRDGFYKAVGENVRHLKIKGSNKINGHCPARIIAVIQESGQIQVNNYQTHVGHEKDVGRLSLSAEEKKKIVAKLKAKIPIREIIRQVKESVDTEEGLKRIQLVTRQNLRNLRAKNRINKNTLNIQQDTPNNSHADAMITFMQNILNNKVVSNDQMKRFFDFCNELFKDSPNIQRNGEHEQ